MAGSKKTKVLLLEGNYDPSDIWKMHLTSSEKKVQNTGLRESLRRLGYNFSSFDPAISGQLDSLKQEILTVKPDVVFIALHGTFYKEGSIQELMDSLAVPYTHSGALAARIVDNKIETKKVCQKAGILTPEFIESSWNAVRSEHPVDRPYVIKPTSEGSGAGVYVIEEYDPPIGETVADWPAEAPMILVEKFIPGMDLTVAVFKDRAIGVMETRSAAGFLDCYSKYWAPSTQNILPANVPDRIYDLAMKNAEQIHHLTGCKVISRSDFRYDPESDQLFFLEIGFDPGLTDMSFFPAICSWKGISFDDIVSALIERAIGKEDSMK